MPQHTAIGDVFDYFLAQMPTRMQSIADIEVDPDVNVVDTFTDRWPIDGCPMFCIGANFPTATDAGDSARAYVELGGQGVEEDFVIPFYTAAGRGDGDQKLARDACLAAYDEVCRLVAEDLSLGGALLDGRWAEIAPATMSATRITTNNGTARWCVLSSGIHCLNHYHPGQ